MEPTLTARMHLWEMAQSSNPRSDFEFNHRTLATLRFHGLDEDVVLSGFNHQNAIFSLKIEKRERDNGPSPYLAVEFEQSFGIGAKFTCSRVEVVDARPCDENGEPLGE